MKRSRRRLDETGQMSIFVALVFQVLFVFFAMVVNIGLIVHDKINLQNSVDFGAYYAAQRQSELMNEIAHINYQIRQDNKLLAWRYRVLGTLGRQTYGLPPQLTAAGTPLPDEPYPPEPGNDAPAICVTNDAWGDVTPQGQTQENYCFRQYRATTVLVPITPIVAPWVPGIFVQRSAETAALARQRTDCASTGPKNWFFTMQMLYAYRQALSVRKEMVYRLRRNLASSDLKDSSLQSVAEGVKQTVRRNLTSTNLEGFDDQSFVVYNSLSHPDCAGQDADGSPTFVEIPTKPLLFFTNVIDPGGGCVLAPQSHENLAGIQGTALYSPALGNLAVEPPTASEQNPEHSSLGFEKNPWCVAYMGVRAVSKPRKPFAPFGQPVTLVARAFAQPFGGRIGPWYRSTWSRNAANSDGPNRVDPLTSPRFVGGTLDGTETQRLPNFSRYPGDQMGLLSKVALGAQRHIIRNFYLPSSGLRLYLANYSTFDDLPTTGDPLPINLNDPPNSPGADVVLIRKAEVAAVSPDLFDTTYYSIDPNWFQNYLQPAQASGLFSGMPAIFGRQPVPISDIGSRMGHPVYNAQTVESQIALAINDGGLDPELLNQDLRYYLRDWRHLLTGWTLPKVQTFTFPDATFGKCEQVAPNEVMVPGKCAQKGGRVGYSVRMLSRDYLFSNKWNVGGDGVGAEAIRNPPDPAF